MNRDANPGFCKYSLPSGVVLVPLAVATMLVFAPVWNCDFVIFDDPLYVTDNPTVLKGLNWEGVQWAFTNLDAGFWFPLTWLSLMADVSLFPDKMAAGMHLTSLLFHTANTVLLFLLLRQLTGAVWRSALVAALFALHPLHVEPVAWISSRKDVLSTLFGLLTLMAYRRYAVAAAAGGGWMRSNVLSLYLLTFLLFVLGLMSKTMLVTLPAVMLLLDWWPLGRCTIYDLRFTIWRLLAEKLSFFVASVACVMVTYVAEHSIGAITSVAAVPLGVRVGNAILSYGQYLWQMVWPVNLTAFYPHPKSFPVVWVVVSGLLLATVSFVAVRQARARPYLLVGWGWYCVTLLPVSGLVQVGSHAHADRYTYVPLMGIYIVLAWLAGDAICRSRSPRQWSVVAVAVSLLALASLGLRSRDQLRHWKDSDALFGHGLAITENNRTAHNLMGVVTWRRGELDKAEYYWREAIRIEPADAEAYNNLGILLQQRGDLSAAEEHFVKAVSIEPRNADFLNNLGQLLAARGRLDEAIVCYQAALKSKPRLAKAHYNIGVTLSEQGRLDEAWGHYEEAMRFDSSFEFSAHRNFGVTLLKQGKAQQALSHLEAAILKSPGDADAQNELGGAMFALGNVEVAVKHYREALRLRPEFADAHNNLGLALVQLRTVDEGVEHYKQALRIDPGHALANENLADVLFLKGRFAEAKSHYTAALSAGTRSAEVHYHLGLILATEGDKAAAIVQLRDAVRLNPDSIEALNAIAWLLATAAEDDLRHGTEAVQFSEHAARLTGFQNSSVLDTLAAAYAETGRFDQAVATAQKAMELFNAAGKEQSYSQVRARQAMYQSGKAYRE